MMMLLTDEEYRALQQCKKCETIREELQNKMETACLEFIQDIVSVNPSRSVDYADHLRSAINKLQASLTK
jgi:hypothetical protein